MAGYMAGYRKFTLAGIVIFFAASLSPAQTPLAPPPSAQIPPSPNQPAPVPPPGIPIPPTQKVPQVAPTQVSPPQVAPPSIKPDPGVPSGNPLPGIAPVDQGLPPTLPGQPLPMPPVESYRPKKAQPLTITSIPGQNRWDDRVPVVKNPSPPTQEEVNRRESLNQYGFGLLLERSDRLIQALQAFEEAAQLDPKAPAVFKAQIPLLVALDRIDEALKASKSVVALDPSDYETWYMQARLLKARNDMQGCKRALQRGLATGIAKTHPELAQQIYFDLGTTLETLEDWKGAAEAFAQTAAILDHPDILVEIGPFDRSTIVARSAEVYERIGHLYRKTRNYDEAVKAYQEAQRRLPAAAGRLNFNLAQVCAEQEKYGDALTYLDGYLRFQPQGKEAYEMRLTLLRKLDRSREIIPWLEQTVQADKHNMNLRLLLADQYGLNRLALKAEQQYLAVGQRSPSVEAYRGLFKLYRQEPSLGIARGLQLLNSTFDNVSKDEAAIAQARAMVAVLHEDADVARAMMQAGIERIDLKRENLAFRTVHFLAVLADRHRQPLEAERFYRQSLRQATPSNEALIYGGLLRVLWKANKYEDVLQVCLDGLREGPKGAQATSLLLFHNDAARALARMQRYPEALKQINQAIATAGDNDLLAVQETRLRILTQAKMYAQAEKEAIDLLKVHNRPSDLMAIRYLLSGIYTAAKHYKSAEEQLDWILRMDPNNATANNDLGYIWADQGKKLDEAEKLIRKAIDLDRRQRKNTRLLTEVEDQDRAAYLDSLGWVLYRRGRFKEARAELERAAGMPDGEDPVIWDHLGDTYYRLNMFPQAHNAWQHAAKLLNEERRQDTRYRDLQRKLQMVRQQVQLR